MHDKILHRLQLLRKCNLLINLGSKLHKYKILKKKMSFGTILKTFAFCALNSVFDVSHSYILFCNI